MSRAKAKKKAEKDIKKITHKIETSIVKNNK